MIAETAPILVVAISLVAVSASSQSAIGFAIGGDPIPMCNRSHTSGPHRCQNAIGSTAPCAQEFHWDYTGTHQTVWVDPSDSNKVLCTATTDCVLLKGEFVKKREPDCQVNDGESMQ